MFFPIGVFSGDEPLERDKRAMRGDDVFMVPTAMLLQLRPSATKGSVPKDDMCGTAPVHH